MGSPSLNPGLLCCLFFFRNPDGDKKPWCFFKVNNAKVKWEYCDVSACSAPGKTVAIWRSGSEEVVDTQTFPELSLSHPYPPSTPASPFAILVATQLRDPLLSGRADLGSFADSGLLAPSQCIQQIPVTCVLYARRCARPSVHSGDQTLAGSPQPLRMQHGLSSSFTVFLKVCLCPLLCPHLKLCTLLP